MLVWIYFKSPGLTCLSWPLVTNQENISVIFKPKGGSVTCYVCVSDYERNIKRWSEENAFYFNFLTQTQEKQKLTIIRRDLNIQTDLVSKFLGTPLHPPLLSSPLYFLFFSLLFERVEFFFVISRRISGCK